MGKNEKYGYNMDPNMGKKSEKAALQTLKEWVDNSSSIVFFGGAGVSTESGIPDFRSENGLFNEKYMYPPETILSRSFYRAKPQVFYEFYREKLLYDGIEPNVTHHKLAQWEKEGRLRAVITQNIDGLHQCAGSREVIELHGSVLRNYCESCGAYYGMDFMNRTRGVPMCVCGGIVKPDVVLYEEGLNDETVRKAIAYIIHADVLIIGGTSLAVYPAAGLIDYYRGDKLVLINKSPTPMDDQANLLLRSSLGEVFSQL